MKYALLFLTALVLLVSACSAPPSDLQRAQTADTTTDTATDASDSTDETDDSALSTAGLDITDEDSTIVSIDTATSTFNFEGFGVGKSHVGMFTTWSGIVTLDENDMPAAGTITVDAASVKSDGERLENHLRSEDFFHVEMYPEIIFDAHTITDSSITGTLLFHGVSKEITFDADVSSDAVSADFLITLEDFGISYTGVNEEARIFFTVVFENSDVVENETDLEMSESTEEEDTQSEALEE